ncbi:MAG: CheR family methyltransferase [Leptolyngbyaceae cyanobacterium MO_188.B28]|nr:CheR family methyltransferase [Leptolyngbyaceae cyanobacterium MO_188.B28]
MISDNSTPNSSEFTESNAQSLPTTQAEAQVVGETDELEGDSPEENSFFVVGIGASAGGLRALEEFFDNMPSDSGAAFVVIQHLSPDYKSMMIELLNRRTNMAMHRVVEQMRLEPNTIYFIPAGQNLVVANRRFHLIPQDRGEGRLPDFPIDLFFRSLATESKEHALSIVLSGTGSDGSRGIQEVSEMGGIVLAQVPDTAEFDGMPQSAIATGVVDMVLPPSELAQAAYQFVTSPIELQAFRNNQQNRLEPIQLQRIVNIVEQYENIDFTQYKLSTLTRRIQRRCLLAGYADLDSYIRRLESSEEERGTLRNDLLITVTRFFRDVEAWQLLEESIIPQIVEQATSDQPVRIWIAACATGEEAYSMAILLRERLDHCQPSIKAKIFATDIDQVALSRASAGIYPASLVSNLSEERLNRFFIRRNDDSFEVSRSLREMIIFANHNLAKDAGFTNIDLVSCRNVLIYMQPALQNQVLRNLHFALKAKGFLFLGDSEILGNLLESEFKILHRTWKIYQKLRDVKLPLATQDIAALSAKSLHIRPIATKPLPRFDPLLEDAFKTLLKQRETTCLLVDRQAQLLYLCGDALNLLKVPEGRSSKDILTMLPQPLQLPLSTALHRVRQGKEKFVQYSGFQIPRAGDNNLTVNLEVSQKTANRSTGEFFMVVISLENSPQIANFSSRVEADADTAQYVLQIEQELQRTRENLQATIEELETSNEEQQASNEELTASNEELQSANEELQSANEELYTVNNEYQAKIQELTELNNDLDNLLGNIEIGVIFLDNELRIRKFTATATIACNLVKADVNRPIGHLSHNLDDVDLLELLEKVKQQGKMIEREVQVRQQGTHLLMRIHPYLKDNGMADGLILTFVNVDDIKQSQLQLEAMEAKLRQSNEILEQEVQKRTAELANSRHFLESINQTTPNSIYLYDLSAKSLVFANRAFEALLGYSSDELHEMGAEYHQQIIHPDDRAKVEAHHHAILQADIANNAIFDIEFQVCDSSGNWRWLYNQEVIFANAEDERPTVVLGTAVDITDRKRTEAALQESQERYTLVVQGVGAGVWDWNILTNTNYMSPRFKQILGYEEDEIENLLDSWESRVHPDDLDWVCKLRHNHLEHQTPYEAEYRMQTKTGDNIWIYDTAQAIWDDAGNPIRMAGSIIDISDRKAAEENLRESEARYRRLYENTPVMLHSINSNGELISVSDHWLQTFGYERSEVIGRKSTEFLTAESQQYAKEVILPEYFKTGVCKDVPYQMVRQDGGIRDVLLSATADWDESGAFVRSLEVLIDVTDRNKTQAELTRYQEHLEELVEDRAAEIQQTNQDLQAEVLERRQAESKLAKRAKALEQSNADLEQFAYVISHDLQEPLRAMTVFSQLLGGRYRDQLDSTANEYITHIVEGALRMQALIDGILAFSRVAHQARPPETMELEIELEQVLAAAIKNLSAAIADSQATVTYDALPKLKIDKNQIVQLFQNLIGNAIKFRGAEPPRIHITAEHQLHQWVFSIQDNGIGIPKEQQTRMFALFQRLHTRKQYEGYGIGLAICKKIVERHQGRIWVDSEPGNGTTLYFTIATNKGSSKGDPSKDRTLNDIKTKLDKSLNFLI